MPNDKHLPVCPFYKRHMTRSITCEDVNRTFSDPEEKEMWLRKYCDTSAWEECEYAKNLNAAYDKLFKGDDMAIMENETKALEKEIKKLSTLLGKCEKRVERQQKKIDELIGVNKALMRVNNELEAQKKHWYKRWREENAGKRIDDLSKTVMEQADKVLSLYKTVACYLLNKAGGTVYEDDVTSWADGKVYTIYREYDDTGRLAWQLMAGEYQEDPKEEFVYGEGCDDIPVNAQGTEVRQQEGSD